MEPSRISQDRCRNCRRFHFFSIVVGVGTLMIRRRFRVPCLRVHPRSRGHGYHGPGPSHLFRGHITLLQSATTDDYDCRDSPTWTFAVVGPQTMHVMPHNNMKLCWVGSSPHYFLPKKMRFRPRRLYCSQYGKEQTSHATQLGKVLLDFFRFLSMRRRGTTTCGGKSKRQIGMETLVLGAVVFLKAGGLWSIETSGMKASFDIHVGENRQVGGRPDLVVEPIRAVTT